MIKLLIIFLIIFLFLYGLERKYKENFEVYTQGPYYYRKTGSNPLGFYQKNYYRLPYRYPFKFHSTYPSPYMSYYNLL